MKVIKVNLNLITIRFSTILQLKFSQIKLSKRILCHTNRVSFQILKSLHTQASWREHTGKSGYIRTGRGVGAPLHDDRSIREVEKHLVETLFM